MASAELLDFNSLLAPIPGDQAAGVDIRTDWSPTSVYYAIKDARTNARAIERRMLQDPEGTEARPDWGPVLELAPKILTEQSKDLEIAAWFTEALVRKHGFAGLRDGFRLCRELSATYWEQLFPMPDEEDGMLVRVAPLTGLNGEDGEGTLIAPIANVPLTGGVTVGPFSSWHYDQAGALDQMDDPARREERIEQGAASLRMIDQAVMETQPEFFQNLLEDIDQVEDEFAALCEFLEEKCGPSVAPPSSNIRNAIATSREVLTNIAKDVLPSSVDADEELESLDNDDVTAAAMAERGAQKKVMTRDDAFRTLLQVAEFFRRTEPHTPVSFLLEQAVRWGKMPLPELLLELIPDDASRDHLFKLVGIQSPESSDSTE